MKISLNLFEVGLAKETGNHVKNVIGQSKSGINNEAKTNTNTDKVLTAHTSSHVFQCNNHQCLETSERRLMQSTVANI